MIGLGTATPPLRLSQQEIYQIYCDTLPLSEQSRTVLHQHLIKDESIAFRHMGMESLAKALRESPDEARARFEEFAVPTAVEAAKQALAEARVAPEEVDAMVITTCTGYLCPGLTSYVGEALGLKAGVWPFDLAGMGCGAALAAWETGGNFLHRHPGGLVLTLAVEMCTSTLFPSEEPATLITHTLFGDGAAATVLTDRPGQEGIRLRDLTAGLFPEHREYLRYHTVESRLKIKLSPRVPVLGTRHSMEVVGRLLAENGLARQDIAHWIFHTGGKSVIDAIQKALELPDEAVAPSRAVLHSYGNMSSPSVLFVLDEVRKKSAPQPGDLGLICSFGAGFAVFAGLLEFGP